MAADGRVVRQKRLPLRSFSCGTYSTNDVEWQVSSAQPVFCVTIKRTYRLTFKYWDLFSFLDRTPEAKPKRAGKRAKLDQPSPTFEIDVHCPPILQWFTLCPGSQRKQWVNCADFTAGGQLSKVRRFVFVGPAQSFQVFRQTLEQFPSGAAANTLINALLEQPTPFVTSTFFHTVLDPSLARLKEERSKVMQDALVPDNEQTGKTSKRSKSTKSSAKKKKKKSKKKHTRVDERTGRAKRKADEVSDTAEPAIAAGDTTAVAADSCLPPYYFYKPGQEETFLTLPQDIQLRVMTMLPLADIQTVSWTCKTMRELVLSNAVPHFPS
eukprot:TRINITY_DN9320_c0_g1_i2.p1 TRINITY_DN9320_c0_g1~~TRINITY_DN9320_c0_g1_i2.p1  ORF type:complete len:342 (-),score=45.91 TRINITY_DN9320_c0_g1_i2:849-1820(-)